MVEQINAALKAKDNRKFYKLLRSYVKAHDFDGLCEKFKLSPIRVINIIGSTMRTKTVTFYIRSLWTEVVTEVKLVPIISIRMFKNEMGF